MWLMIILVDGNIRCEIVYPGLTPALTSSVGDCLFGAVSVCLFGSIESEKLLRLATVIHGITHFDHYREMVSTPWLSSINYSCIFICYS